MLKYFYYCFKRAIQNIHKSLLVNTITVVTVGIAFLLLSSYILLLSNLNRWISVSGDQFKLEAYLSASLSDNEIDSIKNNLGNDPNIAAVELINEDKARKDFLNKHPDFKNVVEGLKQNPFPASLKVKVKTTSANQVRQIANSISLVNGIENVDYGARWLDRYLALMGALKIGSYILAALIIFSCIFLVSNTIRLNILTRKQIIEIYKLVGGTQLFIGIPFIFEGIILTFLGTSVAILILYLIFTLVLSSMQSEIGYLLSGLNFSFLSSRNILFILGVGCFSGIIGSVLSLRRFLRY